MLTTKHKIALARAAATVVIASRKARGLGVTAEVRRRNLNWKLDLREGIDFAVYILGAFERNTQRQYTQILRPGHVVFDIGANMGAHALPFARLVGDTGHVYAFEPTKFAYSKLVANIAINPSLRRRFTAEQIMLGDASAVAPPSEIIASWPLFKRIGGHPMHGGHPKSTEGAQVATIDEYSRTHGITRLDLVKLDVDGAECSVIRGASETLERFRPAIVLELAPDVLEESTDSFATLVNLLTNAGYRLLRRPRAQPLPMKADILSSLVPRGASLNVWAQTV